MIQASFYASLYCTYMYSIKKLAKYFFPGQLIGEGTDLPCLNRLFLVYPFSFEGKLTQYIGRIQRGRMLEGVFMIIGI